MRTLVYKRTHPGDPDPEGRFGIEDCMGQDRSWGFEAVIGVGGIGTEPRSHGLEGKVNWIGIGPRKTPLPGKRGPLVTFDHFLLFEAEGPDFLSLAPRLAERMYQQNVRTVMDDIDSAELAEIEELLSMARSAPPSRASGSSGYASDSLRGTARGSAAPTSSGCRGGSAPAPKPVRGCSR